MSQLTKVFSMSAVALAASLLVSACGSGDAEPPPDTFPPTVTITDNVPAATATGPVTFTFTFSENVGASFVADDVTVVGGAKGAFAMGADGTSATLVVTPTANAAGTIELSVAAGKFTDLAGNASTAAAAVSQAFNTVVDSTPPTVAITDNEPGATATGPVTFTFTFSEDVGTSFVLADVGVTGGAAGALTKASATQYTLVVTPAAASTGTINVTVAAGAFADAAANVNTASASASQAYNTVVVVPPPSSGNTGTCTPSTSVSCVGFQEATIGLEAFEGLGAASAVGNDPADATNKVAKFVKVAAGQPWAGATVYTVAADKSVARAGFETSKIVTLRVYSPAVGKKIRMKWENAADNTQTIEKDALTTKSGEWETLTFDFTTVASGTAAYNPAGTYNKVSLFPDFLVAAPAGAGETYYFDEIKYAAYVASGGGGGGGSGTDLVAGKFASNYAATATAWKSTENGDAGTYVDTSVPTQYWWNGVAPGDATPSFYFGYGLRKTAKPWGFGAFVKAPANGTAKVASYSNVRIAVWGNDELMNIRPTLTTILKGPTVASCTPELKSTMRVAANGAQTYTLPLSGFTIQTACGFTTVAQALAAGVTEVHIQVLGDNVQYVTGGNADGDYPNGLNVGPITFN